MARYSVKIKPSAVREIEVIPQKKTRQRIIRRIHALADDPRLDGCEKLSGQSKYRVRQGRYRVVFSVGDQDLVIFVVKVGHRSSVYR